LGFVNVYVTFTGPTTIGALVRHFTALDFQVL